MDATVEIPPSYKINRFEAAFKLDLQAVRLRNSVKRGIVNWDGDLFVIG